MEQPQPSPDELVRAVVAQIEERFQRGDKAEAIRADLIAKGIPADVVDTLLRAYTPNKWERGTLGTILRILAFAVMIGGGFLFLGNQIGFFTTFPFAGTITILLGVGILAVCGMKR
jgi:hypothetical protein